MRQILHRYPLKTRRILEVIIPGLSWFLITMPLWLSIWHPALVAYLIITFDVFWFYKSATLALHAIQSFVTMNAHIKVDWLTLSRSLPHFDDLHHVLII